MFGVTSSPAARGPDKTSDGEERRRGFILSDETTVAILWAIVIVGLVALAAFTISRLVH